MGLPHLLLAVFATATAVAAQGVLTDGNSQLPTCAQACPLLVQAAQACSATDVASQGAWVCFCQSAYLTNLRTSATGVCDSTCTDAADLQQVSTWYTTNCGDDFGASEHPGSGTAATTAPAASDGDATAAAADDGDAADASTADATTTTASPSSNGQNTLNGVNIGADKPETWWENHYQWIVMVIILAIAFPLIAWGAVWLKRRHDRKQDQINTGFNAGITGRGTDMTDHNVNKSTTSVQTSAAGIDHGLSASGRNSPQRTRDAYMPYGYGYSRGDSRNGEAKPVHPLARAEPAVDMVEERGPKGKKVLVRERSIGEGSSHSSGWV